MYNTVIEFSKRMSQRWWHKLFFTLIPLTRILINTFSTRGHCWEDPRTQGWGLNTSLYNRLHWKNKRSSYMLITLSLTQASRAPCREVSLEPFFLPVRVGGETVTNQALSALFTNPYSYLTSWVCRGIWRPQSLGIYGGGLESGVRVGW